MKKIGLRQGLQIDIHVNKDVQKNNLLFFNDGPFVSSVFDSRTLPDGTLVKGLLWTKGQNVVGRYS